MTASRRLMPTVIVSRTPKPGREAEFIEWMEHLSAAAQLAPGHLDSSVEPAGELHPGEWVVIYQFENSELLQAWLESPERKEIIEAGADLVVGDSREQVVALADQPERVTAVSSFTVRPGIEHEFEMLQRRLERLRRSRPGS
jgi:antibiotic biosynthesis monooxygenase (ABM) superfamily enzyme